MTSSPFPDTRWGSENSRLRGPGNAFATTTVGSWVIRHLSGADAWLLRRTKGKYTVLGPMGMPLLLLNTTGAKSGKPRTSPLIYLRRGDRLFVVGSNFGQATHPGWTANLLANPSATVTMGGRDIPVTATRLHGAEADEVYCAMSEVSDVYPVYKTRTDRDIRVFALSADR
jgi:deazaflavin-dependent oxidoreductase (nitroreductase family)